MKLNLDGTLGEIDHMPLFVENDREADLNSWHAYEHRPDAAGVAT